VQLTIIESPFRSLVGPLLAYIDAMHAQHPGKTLTVVLPEMVPAHWWEQVLHNQTALRLKGALLFRPGVVVADVPYHLRRHRTPPPRGEPVDKRMQHFSQNGTPKPPRPPRKPRVIKHS
jgi:hypothetical protein